MNLKNLTDDSPSSTRIPDTASVEYRAEDPTVPILRLHKMSQDQVRREISVHPLVWAETLDLLPRQHIVIFQKPTA